MWNGPLRCGGPLGAEPNPSSLFWPSPAVDAPPAPPPPPCLWASVFHVDPGSSPGGPWSSPTSPGLGTDSCPSAGEGEEGVALPVAVGRHLGGPGPRAPRTPRVLATDRRRRALGGCSGRSGCSGPAREVNPGLEVPGGESAWGAPVPGVLTAWRRPLCQRGRLPRTQILSEGAEPGNTLCSVEQPPSSLPCSLLPPALSAFSSLPRSQGGGGGGEGAAGQTSQRHPRSHL